MNFRLGVAAVSAIAAAGVLAGCGPITRESAPTPTWTVAATTTRAPRITQATTTDPTTTVVTVVTTVTEPAIGVDPTCAKWWTAVANYRILFDKPDADEQEVLAWVVNTYLPNQDFWATETEAQHQQEIRDAKARVSTCHLR